MAQDTFSKNETLVGFWDSCFAMTDEMREEIRELASHDWREMAPAQKLADAVAALGKCRKVVDYGCGTGWASIGAAKSGCADVKAVEVSENGARVTAATVKAFGVADRVRTLRVTPNWLLGESSEEYDGIVCSNVLDVVPAETAEEILSELARVASKDAVAVISMNYYISPETAIEKGLECPDGRELYVDGVLRMVLRTDEEWSALLGKYFTIEKLDHFAWEGETEERRRLFVLRKR